MLAAAFLTRSQTKSAFARSLVQDSGAPAWLSTAPRDSCLIAALAALAVSDGSLCLMARCARGDVRRGAAVFVGSDETTGSENQLCILMRFVGHLL